MCRRLVDVLCLYGSYGLLKLQDWTLLNIVQVILINGYYFFVLQNDTCCENIGLLIRVLEGRSLKCGKACGRDNSVEHLLYAHPSLVMHLKLLFRLIVVHSFALYTTWLW